VLSALLLALWAGALGAAEPSLEYAVKGTYLYKFGPFVEWPAASFAAEDSPVNICVIGRDPFGPALDQAVDGQRIGERPIRLWRLPVAGRESACHIMFAAGSPQQSIPEALAAVRGMPVLTVTDAGAAGAASSIISFAIENNRVRFDIDDQAAEQNGLQIRAQLLDLARNIRPRGAP
jgi:hypothetical protein